MQKAADESYTGLVGGFCGPAMVADRASQSPRTHAAQMDILDHPTLKSPN
ncbi:MAG TPA: hypothetical protein VNY55_12920 [Mycobacterium sp.]|nr:hypothetical protein [Mycobacterium sp.]